MNLHDLRPAPGSRQKAKRLGQGIGSGNGKTAGKGTKGHKSRAGGGVRPGFEGGQMPITRRVPKRGFNNARFAKSYQIINLEQLADRFEAGSVVGVEDLYRAGLVRDLTKPVKILARGEISQGLTLRVHAFSAQAAEKIAAAGGKAEVI
ncbi:MULTISPECIES: 50S ribosomal protein L15 [Aminobacterium]|jgi:large subunit ribosomal protein L15|uniref:50S ribosomal protein L15 n=1 Tax=Aminobacterium TaxID=81466 RepID=UPI000465E290|nr:MULTISPECIES: 50S ribosomal protein L15 [Aminobacterium]